MIVLALYRSPSGNFESFVEGLSDCLGHVMKPSSTHTFKHVLVGGDYNVCFDGQEYSAESLRLLRLFSTYGLHVTNVLPTRGVARLDTVVTNLHKDVCVTHVVDPVVADHSALVTSVSLPSEDVSSDFPSWCANYKCYTRTGLKDDCSMKQFRESLLEVDWAQYLGTPCDHCPPLQMSYSVTFSPSFVLYLTTVFRSKKNVRVLLELIKI